MSEAQAQKIADLRRAYDAYRKTLKVDALEEERRGLEEKMGEPGFWDAQEAAQKTVLRLKGLKELTDTCNRLRQRLDDVATLEELAELEGDPAAKEEVERELAGIQQGVDGLQLRTYFTGEHDHLSAFVQIHPGAGGIDACDWAEMVMRLLSRYSERRGFEVEVTELDHEEQAGIKSATLRVKGEGAFGWLKSERGTHRLVRISPFDAQSRRQTAFAAVDITPEFDDKIEVDIKEADLRVDTYSAGGPGGQHVNKTQSAVRITHKPTGIVVQCQSERSQHANRRTCMSMLKNRILRLEIEKREAAAVAGWQTKSNMGFGAEDRIRTYTLQPFTLAKDMRTGFSETNVQAVLDGKIDGFVEAYLKWAAEGMPPRRGASDE